jgi:hypothetical protein
MHESKYIVSLDGDQPECYRHYGADYSQTLVRLLPLPCPSLVGQSNKSVNGNVHGVLIALIDWLSEIQASCRSITLFLS